MYISTSIVFVPHLCQHWILSVFFILTTLLVLWNHTVVLNYICLMMDESSNSSNGFWPFDYLFDNHFFKSLAHLPSHAPLHPFELYFFFFICRVLCIFWNVIYWIYLLKNISSYFMACLLTILMLSYNAQKSSLWCSLNYQKNFKVSAFCILLKKSFPNPG